MEAIVWITVIMVAVVLWRISRRGRRRATRALRMLGARTGGQYHAGGWGMPQELRIAHGRKRLQVTLHDISVAGDQYHAEIRTTWPAEHPDLDRAEPTRLVVAERTLSDQGASDDLREAAQHLESLPAVDEAWVQATGGKFSCGAILDRADVATVAEWFEAALRLHDLLAAESSVGITFLGRHHPAADSEAHCQVCGIAIEAGEVTRCSRCGTPHHIDCWNYNGGCAIYGCKQRSVG